MGTKNKPGDFDCYANAEPDEPMFVLLGRDPLAGFLVRYWAWLRERRSSRSADKIEEAKRCADAMDVWAKSKGKFPITQGDGFLVADAVRSTWRSSPPDSSPFEEAIRLVELLTDDHCAGPFDRLPGETCKEAMSRIQGVPMLGCRHCQARAFLARVARP